MIATAALPEPGFCEDFSRLPSDRLDRMRQAADEVLEALDEVAVRGGHVVTDLIGEATFTIGEHYPPDDFYDHDTGAGFYYHAHHDDPRAYPDGFHSLPERGHFHLLMNRLAVPKGIKPLKRPGRPIKGWGQCHIVAIVMARSGQPCRLFTLNQWPSQEWLYPAPVVIDLVDRFLLSEPAKETSATRWVFAMAALFQPQISHLLSQRDFMLTTQTPTPPSRSIYTDPRVEITSMIEIDLDHQIAAVDRALSPWASPSPIASSGLSD